MKKLSVILVLCFAFFTSSAHATARMHAREAKETAQQNTQLRNLVVQELRKVREAQQEAQTNNCDK